MSEFCVKHGTQENCCYECVAENFQDTISELEQQIESQKHHIKKLRYDERNDELKLAIYFNEGTIKNLESKVEALDQQIKAMRNCENCQHNKDCPTELFTELVKFNGCVNYSGWEMKEDKDND